MPRIMPDNDDIWLMAYVIVGTAFAFKIEPSAILSKSHESRVVIARYTAVALIRRVLKHLSSTTIAACLHCQHGTILRASTMAKATELKRLERLLGFTDEKEEKSNDN